MLKQEQTKMHGPPVFTTIFSNEGVIESCVISSDEFFKSFTFSFY